MNSLITRRVNNNNHEEEGHTTSSSPTRGYYNGAESFLVGICPHYWSFVPMAVVDVQTLQLVDGVYCTMMVEEKKDSDNSSSSISPAGTARNNHNIKKFVPVSKCQLVGFIVNIKLNSNDSTLYVLDDGTGLIDCIVWTNEGDTLYDLPLLCLDDQEQQQLQSASNSYKLGDQVRIFGKIQCVAIRSQSDDDDVAVDVAGKNCHLKQTLREVQVVNMERIHSPSSTPSISMDAEARHWMACHKSVINTPDYSRMTISGVPPLQPWELSSHCLVQPQAARRLKRKLQNANDVLQILGPAIRSHVHKDREKKSSAAPTENEDHCLAAWRVFGASCCCSLPYMDSLLYCHCQAKTEKLDPKLRFRDAVLEVLLKMEEQSYTHDDNNNKIGHDNSSKKALRFNYKLLVTNARLRQIAAKEVVAATDTKTTDNHNLSMNVNRIFLQTFSALRHDGIIYLEDVEADMYLLLSRKRVLEPYIKSKIENPNVVNGTAPSPRKTFLNLETAPPFLSKVHFQRLLYIRRTQQLASTTTDHSKIST